MNKKINIEIEEKFCFLLEDARIKTNHRLFAILNYRALASFTINIYEGIRKPKEVEGTQSILVSSLKKCL